MSYQIFKMIQKEDEMKEETLINIKIKTLNQTIYEIIVNPLKSIRSFMSQIEQKTHVQIYSQRLLYRGIVLDIDKSLADYRIEEESIIQLVVNKIPSQISAQSSLRRNDQRNNNYSKEHNKLKKHRYLQLRINGFRLKKQESMQVLQQNKHIIDQLLECLNNNFLQEVTPFKMERRKLQIGQWVDIRDISGQWVEGQVIKHYGQYVLIHYNGLDNKWNEWVTTASQRIMPFRTFTVQIDRCDYLSPFPIYPRQLKFKNNLSSLEVFINQLTHSFDSLNRVMKDLQFENKESQVDESLKNVSNMSILQHSIIQQTVEQVAEDNHIQEEERKEQFETHNKEQFETPNKQVPLGDNLSNKCEDDRSNKCDNDDISNKSYKSKRSEGLVDTSSMKSLINQSRKRQNKVFFDNSEEAQSVRSVKNKNTNRNYNAINQEYILQEQDSQYNEQQLEDAGIARKNELKRKMKASQLAPLLDRMGRLMIDLAPHLALLGHTDQSTNSTYINENLSTFTNEGSLESKISQLNKQLVGANGNEERQEEKKTSFCQFQIPVMLTPIEIFRLNRLLQNEKRTTMQSM